VEPVIRRLAARHSSSFLILQAGQNEEGAVLRNSKNGALA